MPKGVYKRSPRRIKSLSDRFWSHVNKTEGCWIWDHIVQDKRYGQIRVGLVMKKAHRVSYELNVGAVPKGQFVLHKCDNPSCVRPDHLFLGTQMDNVLDMMSKNRGLKAKGVDCHLSRLSESDIQGIRSAYSVGGVSFVEIGRVYGVTGANISNIIKRKTWKHVV